MNSQDVFDMQMMNQANKIEKEYKLVASQAKSLRKSLEMIAQKTCNLKYAQKQLGGENKMFSMGDGELRDFIIENVLEQKISFIKSLEEVQALYFQEIEEKKQLAKKVLDLQRQIENCSQSHPFQNSQTSTKNIKEENKKEIVELEDILTVNGKVWDIPIEIQKLNIYQEEIIKVMGKFGYSETRQIYDEVMNRIDVQETTLKNQLSGLIESTVLEAEDVSTFLRRNLNLYGLTVLGESIYKHLTGKSPIKAEKNKLKTQHSSLKHAYSIKDTATILEGLGYTNISIDSSSNQIPVSGGNRYVPDIIANFDANKKTYWEVELAHHKDSDFFEKLQKAAKVTDTVYIIAPDKIAFDKLKNQIGRYKVDVTKKGIKTQLTIFIGTMNHLKKREIFSNGECRVKIG